MRTIQFVLIGGGLLLLLVAWGFATQAPWATDLWVWEDGRLSYLFVASMQAAIAAAMIWIGLTGAWHMVAAGALNLFVMLGGIALFLLGSALQADPPFAVTPKVWLYGVGCAIFALINLPLIFWARRFPLVDQQPMPLGLRFAFGLFVFALVAVGIAMVAKVPNVFPWDLKPETSVLFGWMFLGDAFYFLFALLQPRWHNAATQLWSFLAYDLVLIGPFLQRLQVINTTEQYWTWYYSLVIYIGILLFSAAVAIYYLLIQRDTRVWFRPATPQFVTIGRQ
jgi:hypothetical protein